MQEALFRQALGLTQPWDVERVALDVTPSRIDLYVVWRASSRHACVGMRWMPTGGRLSVWPRRWGATSTKCMRLCVSGPHTDGGESIDIAWFEPDHHIVPAAAHFFMRRFSNMRWAILTPQCSVHWDLQQLQFAEGSCAAAAPRPDAGEALWLTYYQSTFNPARLKEQAMQREMPRKYWKNLPEARLISEMVASATRRTGRMLDVPPHGGAKRASLAFNHLPV